VSRAELLLALGAAQWRAGDTRAAQETFVEVAGLARQIGRADLLARAALGYGTGLGGYARSVRADETLVELIEEALEALGPADSVLRARLLARLSVELYHTAERERRDRLSLEAVEMADRLEVPAVRLTARYARQWSGLGPDVPLADRLTDASELVELAYSVGDADVAYHGHLLRMLALVEQGELDAADEEHVRAANLVEQLRMPSLAPWMRLYESMRAWMAGRFAEAERLASASLDAAVAASGDPEPAVVLVGGHLIAQTVFRSGIEDYVGTIQNLAQLQPHERTVRCFIPFAHREIGDRDAARVAFDNYVDDALEGLPRDAQWLSSVWALAMACAFIGDERRAAKLYELLEPFADRWVTSEAFICFGPATMALGALATVQGRYPEAEAHLRSAVAETTSRNVPPLLAAARYELAVLLTTRRTAADLEEAGAVLAAAAHVADDLDLTSLQAKIKMLPLG
jgi:tetratricopeptide (TPR) repeat protein